MKSTSGPFLSDASNRLLCRVYEKKIIPRPLKPGFENNTKSKAREDIYCQKGRQLTKLSSGVEKPEKCFQQQSKITSESVPTSAIIADQAIENIRGDGNNRFVDRVEASGDHRLAGAHEIKRGVYHKSMPPPSREMTKAILCRMRRRKEVSSDPYCNQCSNSHLPDGTNVFASLPPEPVGVDNPNTAENPTPVLGEGISSSIIDLSIGIETVFNDEKENANTIDSSLPFHAARNMDNQICNSEGNTYVNSSSNNLPLLTDSGLPKGGSKNAVVTESERTFDAMGEHSNFGAIASNELENNTQQNCSHDDVTATMVIPSFNADRSNSHDTGERVKDSSFIENGCNYNLTSFKDIIGHQSAKLRLEEVLLPLSIPPSLSKELLKGIRTLPASILLHGPPGCGKTQLAKALAGEANAAFLSIGPSDILNKYVGESEAAIRGIFEEGIRMAQVNETGTKCSIIFFDEIDALGLSRGFSRHGDTSGSSVSDNPSRRVLAELLIQLTRINSTQGSFELPLIDGRNDRTKCISGSEIAKESPFGSDGAESDACNDYRATISGENSRLVRVIVIAATNRPEDCDPALIRRFSIQVPVGLPSHKDRREILKQNLIDIEHTITNQDLLDLSSVTDGWSGSDLNSLSRDAVMAPVRECIRRNAMRKRKMRSPLYPTQSRRKLSFTENSNGLAVDQNSDSGVSIQADKIDSDSFFSIQHIILEEMKNLRPVRLLDFKQALRSSFSRTYSDLADSPLAQFGWVKESLEKNSILAECLTEHYDSSSDEEEDLSPQAI